MTSNNLAGAALLPSLLMLTACDDPQSFKDSLPFSNHYAASTSMEPTLPKGTSFTGYSVSTPELRRGDILIVRTHQNEDYVVRLVGLPGDKIAIEDGIIILNGEKVEQRRRGSWIVDDEVVGGTMDVYVEQLPGEAEPHRILDEGQTSGDNMPEIALSTDRYFLMGDNRDNAADSRFDDDLIGLGIVSGSQIKRRVDMQSLD